MDHIWSSEDSQSLWDIWNNIRKHPQAFWSTFRNSFKIEFSTLKSCFSAWDATRYISLQNERFVRLFQNLKAFSIFNLWPIPFGSESFKPILKASRSPILSPTTTFIRKLLPFSNFQAEFGKDFLIKVVVSDKKIMIFSKIKRLNPKSGF